MKRKKLNWFLPLVWTICLLCLTGCHGSKDSTAFSVPAHLEEDKKIELTFWAKNDTNKNQANVYKKAINDFQDLYPNISVNMRLYTDYVKIYNDVITNLATDTTPDVCITYPDHIATYMTGQNTVVPLDDLMEDAAYGLGGSEVRFDGPFLEQMIPEYLQECRLEGQHYALPFMRSSEACYINKDYVEALGYEVPDILTWDFIWEVSEAAMEMDAAGNYKVNGQKIMIPFIYKSTDNMMITYLKQIDAGYSTDEGEIGLFSEETSEFLQKISTHTKSGAFSTFKVSGYPANFLNAGQCIFAIDSTAGSTWMGSNAPLVDISKDKIIQFETVVRPVPQVYPDHLYMISQGPSVCVFNKKDSQQVLAAWLFAQYLLTNEVQIGYAKTEGYVPVSAKAREDDEYKAYLSETGEDAAHYSVKIDATNMVLELTGDTFTTAVFNGSASLRDAGGALIEEVVKSTRRKKEINEAFLKDLYEKTGTLYHLDQVGASTAEEKRDLGPLPGTAKALLGGIAAAWVLIALLALRSMWSKRNKR